MKDAYLLGYKLSCVLADSLEQFLMFILIDINQYSRNKSNVLLWRLRNDGSCLFIKLQSTYLMINFPK